MNAGADVSPNRPTTRANCGTVSTSNADSTDGTLGDGLATLQGQVEIRQGTLFIKADVANVTKTDGRVRHIELTGTPVRLQQEIEEQGGAVLTHSRVRDVNVTADGFDVCLDGVDDIFCCRTLINSAGLFATDVARCITGLSAEHVEDTRFAIGHYFAYQGKSPFNHLVYPVPVDGGLGIHATNDMGGSLRFGPDVEWIDTLDYDFDDSRKARFVEAIRHYFPALDESRLSPAYTGIRPKLYGPGEPAKDFVIQGDEVHGLPGLVNLFGIESPGLTACLAIGDHVAALLARR